MPTEEIPAGFAPIGVRKGFLEANGPLYFHWDDDRAALGFRVAPRHCNPGNVCHGGMLATFADMLLPIAARLQAKIEMGFLPTANLTGDFLAPAPLGSGEGRAEAVQITWNLLFAQGLATADGNPCLRANGIFKISAPDSAKRDDFSREAFIPLKSRLRMTSERRSEEFPVRVRYLVIDHPIAIKVDAVLGEKS